MLCKFSQMKFSHIEHPVSNHLPPWSSLLWPCVGDRRRRASGIIVKFTFDVQDCDKRTLISQKWNFRNVAARCETVSQNDFSALAKFWYSAALLGPDCVVIFEQSSWIDRNLVKPSLSYAQTDPSSSESLAAISGKHSSAPERDVSVSCLCLSGLANVNHSAWNEALATCLFSATNLWSKENLWQNNVLTSWKFSGIKSGPGTFHEQKCVLTRKLF